ncbi:MAG: hypothetical protein VB954_11945 [Thalassolituus sp.]|jgi:hypothetical protein|uniref:Uncharacterized protein n=1 Tax=Thalassolituus oleivorans MIL-1 TaxID=1298593 RepID=M5E1L1_9GAMM|nr:hypothetical protein [Thalassolituus oleivorans]PCI48799.1 MAG: hypothetical protein COB43_07095 [Oceanospirillales bacterium]PHQ87785.1 MAG: hypothetical protein COB58_02880 [Thalassobium sp.]APR67745.1 hypothetical protein CN03_12910 [Thalassolituus oleivorans]MBQ0728632.1 hypothetical protein [Thalassolituus oleivorans]MBQ0780529.1 hypothetical protein [Thalassolituus oleivorans]|tara:strand:- start:361 stop:687 length:327 start_codon:yes stop_codon:yes gene_type:complete
MTTMTINQAVEIISDLLQTLENAYWEAANCEEKDRVFNLSQILNAEYIELLKISVQDHHYEYEVISIAKAELLQALNNFAFNCQQHVRRQPTATRLQQLLSQFSNNLN